MSGSDPLGTGPITPEDVENQLSFIEGLLADVSGQDEYLAAILQNQRIQLQRMNQPAGRTVVDVEASSSGGGGGGGGGAGFTAGQLAQGAVSLPQNATGTAARDVQQGDTGPGVFTLNGTRFVTQIRADEQVSQGDTIRVVGPSNLVKVAIEGAGQTDVVPQEPRYFSTEDPITVPTDLEKKVEWGFRASTVILYSFDEAIDLAFVPASESDRRIPLDPAAGDEPFEVSPSDGIQAQELYLKTQDEVSVTTQINILAFF